MLREIWDDFNRWNTRFSLIQILRTANRPIIRGGSRAAATSKMESFVIIVTTSSR